MLRKLLATGVIFAAGYIVGVIFGFRSAVVDYVENDAGTIEAVAKDLYPSPEEGAATEDEVPDEVRAMAAEVNEESEDTTDGDTKGFQ